MNTIVYARFIDEKGNHFIIVHRCHEFEEDFRIKHFGNVTIVVQIIPIIVIEIN